MKLNLGELREQMYSQYLQRIEDTFSSYLVGHTITGHFAWYDPKFNDDFLTLKVDKVIVDSIDFEIESEGQRYFLYDDGEIELLD